MNFCTRGFTGIAAASLLAAFPAAPLGAQPPEGQARVGASLQCLAAAVYYEARSEPEAGQRAVAQVVLNRVRHQAYPKSVCEVVFQGAWRNTGCQFSFTCDGSLAYAPAGQAWNRALSIAAEAMEGRHFAPVGEATHYHTKAVQPYWSRSLTKLAILGSHIFYAGRGSARPAPASAAGTFAVARVGQETAAGNRRQNVVTEQATVVVHRGTVPLLGN